MVEAYEPLLVPIGRNEFSSSEASCVSIIADAHNGQILTLPNQGSYTNIIGFVLLVSNRLKEIGNTGLGEALLQAIHQCTTSADYGGYGISEDVILSEDQERDVLFLCSAFVEALKSESKTTSAPKPLDLRPRGRPGMTMAEKIFAMHDTTRRGHVKAGDVVQVHVDWILASELSWSSIENVYDTLGRPGIFRNDRFWLAGDHRVEPELYEKPAIKKLMALSKRAQQEFKMTDFQGFNYTIMHTEFVRERAQPGMLCIGADSHSCSAGAVSCLSIGMGATDVAMPLITGRTWLSIPETVSICLINAPPKGIGGKDTVLYVLQQFKRNTIAADRVVEFSGPGLRHLSCDARFAISNMCTEFGAVTGIFESDEKTLSFVDRRLQKKHKEKSIFFRPDEDAVYAEKHTVNLAKVESFVALYPSPDNVVPVSEVKGTKLDGCFIGACTTAEEDLLLGAMVLDTAMKKGISPVKEGRRVVVPGSRPIRNKLERLGYLEVYRRAGFKVGVPGCSMCVGQGMDQAASGEVWLSSQNRNFKNRMGPGSIGNLASAATVAASSLFMKITDPREFLDQIDTDHLADILRRRAIDNEVSVCAGTIHYQEPFGRDDVPSVPTETSLDRITKVQREASLSLPNILGCALVVGDFIDTDAIIPSKFLSSMGTTTEAELGSHCMEFFMPSFRAKALSGQSIVVAGKSFGVGSSRDVAVNALKGTGIKAVIAKSFAFIYARNQPNLGLLGILISDEEFYKLAEDGTELEIDLQRCEVSCKGSQFAFRLSEMEKRLIAAGGITKAFQRFGKEIFDKLCQSGSKQNDYGGMRDLEDGIEW